MYEGIIPSDNSEAKKLLKEIPFYYEQNGLTYRLSVAPGAGNKYEKIREQLLLPKSMISYILDIYHTSPIGFHFGMIVTYTRVVQHFYYPNLMEYIRQYVSSCPKCQRISRSPYKAHIQARKIPQIPFAQIHIDLGSILLPGYNRQEGAHRQLHLLIIVCGFSHYVRILPVRNMTTKEVATELLTKFLLIFGFSSSCVYLSLIHI